MKKYYVCLQSVISMFVFAQQKENDSIDSKLIEPISILGNHMKKLGGSGKYIGFGKIQKMNQIDIQNVLRTIPGVNIRDEEGFGLRPNIGLRGTAVNRSAKITIMEDGVLMAPAPYSDPAAYYFPTFSRIYSIEILKGSSQIKNGPFTIGGAINLISTPIPQEFKGFAKLSYGSFGTNQQRIWIGDQKKNFDYVFEINRIASNGFKQLDNKGNTGFDRRDIMGKFRWKTKENASIPQSLMLKFVNMTEDSDETYLGLTYEDYQKNHRRRYAATQKDYLDMNHQNYSLSHQIKPIRNLKINTTAYLGTTYRDWARANSVDGKNLNSILEDPNTYAYQILTGNADGNIVFQSAERTFRTMGVQTLFEYEQNIGVTKNKFQLGTRLHTDKADRYATRSDFKMNNGTMILTNAGIKGNQENQLREAMSFSTYFTYDFQYKRLTISPGFRYENIKLDFSNYGNADSERLGTGLKTAENELMVFLPGIGFNYDLNEKMRIFGGVHKGFSPPGMPNTNTANQQAREEKSTNFELGYEIQKNELRAEIMGFYNDYANILGSDTLSGGGAGTGNLYNAGNAEIYGLETSLFYPIKLKENIKLPISIAYTYSSAKFKENFVNGGGDWGNGTIFSGDLIPFVTPHLFTCSLGIEFPIWNATFTGRYTGETRIKPGHGEIIKPSENTAYNNINALNSFLIIDFSFNYNINRIFTVFGLVNNVLNSKAIVANLPQGFRPNMPFGVNFGIKANL